MRSCTHFVSGERKRGREMAEGAGEEQIEERKRSSPEAFRFRSE